MNPAVCEPEKTAVQGGRASAGDAFPGALLVELNGDEERDAFISDAILGDRQLRVVPPLAQDFEMDDLSRMGAYRDIWTALWATERTNVLAWSHA